MENLTVRRLLPDDFAILREIRLEALRLHPESYSSAVEDWEKFSDEEWRQKLNIPVYAVFDGDHTVGLIGLLGQQSVRTAHRATIVMVYVKSEMRGRGISQLLLQEVYKFARANGISQLELNVSAENTAAIRLYQKEGFTEIGRTPNWMCLNGRMIDDLTMVRAVV